MPRISKVTVLDARGERVTMTTGELSSRRAAGEQFFPTIRMSTRAAYPIPAPGPDGDRDAATSNLARIRAVYERELQLEQEEGKRVEGARKIREQFVEGKKRPNLSPAFSREEYRAYILAHSLFPNVFNRRFTYTQGGSS
jgi:hypothetical protein